MFDAKFMTAVCGYSRRDKHAASAQRTIRARPNQPIALTQSHQRLSWRNRSIEWCSAWMRFSSSGSASSEVWNSEL